VKNEEGFEVFKQTDVPTKNFLCVLGHHRVFGRTLDGSGSHREMMAQRSLTDTLLLVRRSPNSKVCSMVKGRRRTGETRQVSLRL
jgi:hypothetical protein